MSIQIDINHVNGSKRKHQELSELREPEFTNVEPDLDEIRRKAAEYEDYDNLVIIGNGGSITTFRAYLYAFMDEVDKDVRIVSTMEPDYLNRVHSELSGKTLVMPISKSGKTTGVLEALMFFIEKDYDVFGVTTENDEALNQIIEKKDFDLIAHQDVGGRFSGLTETALVPAAFAGIEVEEIREGGEEIYEKLKPENQYNAAINLASTLYEAEKHGYKEVFTPFYSTRMFGFYPLLVQLMHETVCKEENGQTFYGDLGPECQHHTNQRLFGGRKDVVPIFFESEAMEHHELKIPGDLADIPLRSKRLEDLEGNDLQHSLKSELSGVKKALDDEGMPYITVRTTDVSHRNMGRLTGFLQYLAFYSAEFRGVDPFTQPDVEKSKEIGFKQRFDG